MPKLRAGAWSAYRLDAAPLARDDREAVRFYLAWRRQRTSAMLARREERWIVRWLMFLGQFGRPLAEASEADALLLAEQWDDWGWTASPRQHYIAALRAFYNYLVDRGLARSNPWARIHGPKPREFVPCVLDASEIVALEDALRRPTWRDVRDRALICLLSASACRISEALNLDVGDVDLAQRRIHIRRGKGGRDRLGLLTEKAAAAVESYLRLARPLLASGSAGPLFLGARGSRLTGTCAREALLRARRAAGITKHIWPHLLRHSTATDFLDGGAGLEQVQELLGHASIASTRRYIRVAQRRLRKRYDRIVGRRDERARRRRALSRALGAKR